MPKRLVVASVFAAPLALAACQETAPQCLALSPLHETTDGVAGVGSTIQGTSVEDVLLIEAAEVEGAPPDGHAVFYDVACDEDVDCPVDVDCEPEELAAGERISCDVTDEAAVDAYCVYRCTVTVTVTSYDDSICTDAIRAYEFQGQHEPTPLPG
jgi:hypothetical protein